MANDNRESRPGAIERLIADEEAAALAEFRTRDFPSRVRRHISEEMGSGGKHRAFFAGRLWRPAAIAAAAVLLCAVIAFFVLPRGPSSNETAAVIQRALLGMPGLQTPDGTAGLDSDAAGVSGGDSSPFFAAVLAAAYREITAGERAGTVSTAPGGERRSPRLSLQEKFEILIIDKSIERVLTPLANKFKEG